MIPRRIFWLFDLAVLIAAFWVAYTLVPNLQPVITADGLLRSPWWQALGAPASWTGQLPPMRDLAWILAVTTPITLLTLGALGNYRSPLNLSRTRVVVGGLIAPLVGLGFGTLVMASLKANPVSRLFLFSFALSSAVGLIFYRLSLRGYFLQRQAAGSYASNVLLVGLPDGIEWMARYFAENIPQSSYRLAGFLSADYAESELASEVTAERPQLPLPSLGRVGQLGDLLINRPIHEVIAIQPTSGGEWIAQVVRDCDYFGILLRIVPEALLFGERRTLETLYPFEPLHLPAVVLTPPHWDSDALFLKRLFDILVAGLLLILLSPLFLVVAVAIKLTTPKLPVFYPWRVVGQNGVEFTGYKFTTMVADADARKSDLLAQNEMSGPVFKIKDDPRTTPLGRFLRKFSINELPQLWSVLKGDMSLVGPRPAFRHELERYEFWQKRKLSIRPGITCLWQVRGRNKVSNFDDWVRMDLEYIDNWSLWLDFKILMWTVWAVVGGTGS